MLFILLGLVFILLVIFVSFQFSSVQTWAAKKVTSYLSKELNTDFTVESVRVKWPDDIELGKVCILDEKGDTLILTPQISIDASNLNIRDKVVDINKLQLHEPFAHIHKDSSGTSNIKFLIEYFTPEIPNPKKWNINVKSLEITEGTFINTDDTRADKREDLLDFSNLQAMHVNISANSLFVEGSNARFNIDHLSLQEKSGFSINDMRTKANFDSTSVVFNDILIQTDYSEIEGSYRQDFETAWDYSDFNNLITQKLELQNSLIGMQDLNYFSPEFEYFEAPIFVDGKFEGVLSDIQFKDVEFNAGNYTNFTGSGSIKGLPETEKLFIDVSSRDFRTHYSDIESIVLTPLNMQGRDLKIPNNLKELGHISMVADFEGTPKSFKTNGNFSSAIGNISGDLVFSNLQDEGGIKYTGYVKSDDFDLGRILEIDDVSGVNLEGKISGSGLSPEEISTNLEVDVLEITFRDHTYKNIQIQGDIEKNRFDGHAEIDEPSLQALFDGIIDFKQRDPVFDFKAYVTHADLNEINLINEDHKSSLAGAFEADFKGLDLDRMEGTATFSDLYYCKDDLMFDFGSGNLTFSEEDSLRNILVETDMIDAAVSGLFKAKELDQAFLYVLAQHIPSLDLAKEEDFGYTDIDFDIYVRDIAPITGLFFPDYYVNPRTQLSGSLNSFMNRMDIVGSSDSLQINDVSIQDIYIEGVQNNFQGYFVTEIEEIDVSDSFEFNDVWLTNSAYNDTLETDLTWSSKNFGGAGTMTLFTYFQGINSQDIVIMPSQVSIEGDYWSIEDSTFIYRDSTRIAVDNLELTDGTESIFIDGVISENPRDKMILDINKFNLSRLNPFLTGFLFELGGELNAEIIARDVYQDLVGETNGTISTLTLSGEEIGDLRVNSQWDRIKELLTINGGLIAEDTEQIHIDGTYSPFEEVDKLDLTLNFDQFNLDVLNTIPSKTISQIGGQANGSVEVKGDAAKPILRGDLLFDRAGVKINYLNTRYTISDKVVVRPDYFGLDGIILEDENGQKASEVIATVFHENFREWNFDIAVFDFQNFKLLNTTFDQNPLYYGVAYGTGDLFLDGYDKNINITLEAKSEKGTQLNIPLGETGKGETAFQNFITFVDKDTANISLQEEIDLSGISMNMDVEITPDAEIQLIFDEKIGDVMKGRGNGNLKLEITPSSEFTMIGRYEVVEADYLFTLRNSINKKFEVRPGGSITWYGDPYSAELNLEAIYNTRTSVYDLVLEDDREKWKKRVPVECAMNLSESLLNPGIDFEISFPGLSSSIASNLEDRVNSESELNKQVFGLLVLNQFFPPDDGLYNSATDVDWASGAGANTAEFLSAQLSNWLSNISNEFDIGFNYRPGDQITSEEVAVALSTQLFNDRLLLYGNFGVSYGQEYEQNTTSLIGDFILEYMIDENGKFRLKVFNETNEYDATDTNQSPTTQGVGLLYQEDFDTFNDLMRKVGDLFRKKKDTASR